MPSPLHESAADIARRLGLRLHQVQYLVRTRRIRHSTQYGKIRVFDAPAVRQIEQALEWIRHQREGKAGGNP